jgi:murein DD-endopeptidase MepM/ murein hydrolase activator NlpD
MHRILLLFAIIFCVDLGACASTPKYCSHAPQSRPSAVERSPTETGIPKLAIRLSPPVRNYSERRITSTFGHRWGQDLSRKKRHEGVDIKAGAGEEIIAAASGTVVFSGHQHGYGNIVIIDHGNEIATAYAHLFYACVRKGESVEAGQRIGRAGKRGSATGVHLHFEVRLRGDAIDPAPHLCLDSVAR